MVNSPLSMAVTAAESSGNSLNLSIQTNFLKTVWISYVIYDSVSLQKSYIIQQGSTSLGNTPINNTQFYAGTTNIFGCNGFSSPSSSYFTFRTRLSSVLNLNVSSSILTSVSVSYLILENLPSQYCLNCQSGNIYQNGYCVMLCDSLSVSTTQNGVRSCVVCDMEMFMVRSQDNSTCTCALQYYQPQGSPGCVPCDSSCVTCSGATRTNCTSCDTVPPTGTNRVLVNGSCNCVDRYYSDSTIGYGCAACPYSCLTCSGITNNSCLSCSVNLGRVLSNGACVCTTGYRDNGQTEACTCTNPLPNGKCSVPISCQGNQIIVNNTCQCASGYFNISGQCSQCASNQYFDGTGCTPCLNGQVSSNKTQCVCNIGFNKIGGTCQSCKQN